MKEKIFYLIGTIVAVAVLIVGITNITTSTGFSALFEQSSEANTIKVGDQNIDIAAAPKNVKDTISELESYRAHLSETCIYGAAMMLNDLGDEAKEVIDDESKCIHTLVMSIVRDRKVKLKLRAARLAQLKLEEAELLAEGSEAN